MIPGAFTGEKKYIHGKYNKLINEIFVKFERQSYMQLAKL